MTEKSWLDSPETARKYLFELVQHPWTDKDNLDAINCLRRVLKNARTAFVSAMRK